MKIKLPTAGSSTSSCLMTLMLLDRNESEDEKMELIT
jgi:hypothetical protein